MTSAGETHNKNEGSPASGQGGERIAKIIARSGLCSRRDAEALIEAGRVSVNGVLIQSPALDVSAADTILVDGKTLPRREPPRLWRYYKPKGRVTTHKDPEGRPTVFEALPEELPRMISVGRLDFNTEGLLLLTNDGDLARHLELPSTGWARRYRVRAHGTVEQAQLDALSSGITIAKVRYGPIEATLEREQGDNIWIALTIREGKNREVRRIMEHLGLTVNRLIRVSFGPFMLGELEPGQIEEVKASVLKDQLGPRLSRQLGIKRDPLREEKKLPPKREKPTYLRRKAEHDRIRPEKEAPVLKRRRILPLDGSEAPQVDYVPVKPSRFPPGERKGGERRDGGGGRLREGDASKDRFRTGERTRSGRPSAPSPEGQRGPRRSEEGSGERKSRQGFGARRGSNEGPRPDRSGESGRPNRERPGEAREFGRGRPGVAAGGAAGERGPISSKRRGERGEWHAKGPRPPFRRKPEEAVGVSERSEGNNPRRFQKGDRPEAKSGQKPFRFGSQKHDRSEDRGDRLRDRSSSAERRKQPSNRSRSEPTLRIDRQGPSTEAFHKARTPDRDRDGKRKPFKSGGGRSDGPRAGTRSGRGKPRGPERPRP
jgi:23S rRNA pseudouridine2605 synthase